MRRPIPAAVLSVCAEIAAVRETHATLDNLFTYAGAPGDPPPGSKPAKALQWLRAANKDETVQPLEVLGRLIETYMEQPLDPENSWDASRLEDRKRIADVLSQCDLQYIRGGKIGGLLGIASRTLDEFIRDRDLQAVEAEFNRAMENIDTSPREAVSAASNILESVCKVYIEDEGLEKPAKQDLKPVWAVVRKHLGFDPSLVEDQDLQTILSGLIAMVEGIGSLRTHASSAHGTGRKGYKIEPRHARLAIHSAHTVTLFILESWHKRKAV
jgi:hypothetical protein